MSGSDKEAILIRVSEFLAKAVNDLADALTDITKQVTEFKKSLNKIRSDLKTAQVTPVASSSVPLLSTEAATGIASSNLFDFLEGDEAAISTEAEPIGMAEAILLGESAAEVAPPAAPPAIPPVAPPKGPPAAPPVAPPKGPPAAPPVAPPKGAPVAPTAAPTVAPPATAPAVPGMPKVGEGIASLRSEMMQEIKRIKEIFET